MDLATVRGRVRGGRLEVDTQLDLPDDTEVELAVIVEMDDALEDQERLRLDDFLRASMAEMEAGRVVSFDEVLAEI
ncbi:MAG: hypothetical protein IPM54_04720 [Polyangiaceae bacterium]|nr:hypothetical protein [Polyangiaceae bacterium]